MSALVLLPGMNCTEDLWTGCGLDHALTPALDRESVGEQVSALLDRLPPRFVLAGLSLGAIVAMELAVRAPDRVESLVLVSTNSRAPTPGQRESWARWRAALAAGRSARDLQGELLDALLPPEVAATRPDLVERVLAMGRDDDLLRRQLALQESRTDLLPRLPALTVPTLVVSGDHDPICPPPFHATIAEAVPGAGLVSLPAGHLPPVELPREFGDLLRSRGA
ncbi:alpha/beta fold hydrolase [Kineococcus sp. SYSU DK002]|uniref:alpha/beta fold hydrolase n=1 Tax=Kineococcus sp. SYSU DK002 TaxID=3383123 RepID=UPI003D7D2C46